MSIVKNSRHLFNEIATGYPIPGQTTVYDDSQTIDLDKAPLNGGVLVKILYLSIDPYLRFKMRHPEAEKHISLYKFGEPIDSFGVGVILRSQNSAYAVGDHVVSGFPHQEYVVLPKDAPLRVVKNEAKIPWSLYIGIAGMPGMTAYSGWNHFAKSKPSGSTVFVTTAAGPVGATVVQLAKADGHKVIASAGSKDKVDFVKSLGADVVFNYKEQDTREILKREGPIDIYWDHVGGDILDAVLENVRNSGSIVIVCGSVSGYNGTPNPVYRHNLIFERDVTIYGFVNMTIAGRYREAFYKEIPEAIASGQMKYREHIIKGLENAPQAILDVQLGKNEGKSIIQVAAE
ncbi:hypothetical protein EIP91_008528 [Steccherinum ochraceum]|uniref:Enoyl reductase (ER) domain-containing protein n=1 Tax=Steccherinum ochraceum TaxID=92696 RepID=A0A4R0R2S1_9APHY|nr:hypothetical protein EIP91_008528 [Steccherinum ochraceum]